MRSFDRLHNPDFIFSSTWLLYNIQIIIFGWRNCVFDLETKRFFFVCSLIMRIRNQTIYVYQTTWWENCAIANEIALSSVSCMTWKWNEIELTIPLTPALTFKLELARHASILSSSVADSFSHSHENLIGKTLVFFVQHRNIHRHTDKLCNVTLKHSFSDVFLFIWLAIHFLFSVVVWKSKNRRGEKIEQKFRFKFQSEKVSSTLKSLTELQTEVDY